MSYRNPRQALEDPARDVIMAFEPLQEAINQRLKNADEWDEGHIEDLMDLQVELTKMSVRLIRLKAAQW